MTLHRIHRCHAPQPARTNSKARNDSWRCQGRLSPSVTIGGMFAARPFALNTASAIPAGVQACAISTKTTTIKG